MTIMSSMRVKPLFFVIFKNDSFWSDNVGSDVDVHVVGCPRP